MAARGGRRCARRRKMMIKPLLGASSCLAFERNGHVTTPAVVPAQRIHDILPAIDAEYNAQLLATHKQKLRVLLGEEELAAAEAEAMRQKDVGKYWSKRLAAFPPGSMPFLQAFNLWRGCEEVAALASSRELAGTAAALLGVERVRLYQDSLFVKRPGDGETHWHSDLAMAPLDTNDFVTAWLPLQPVPPEVEGGTGLVFASRSHRDVALHFWHGDPREDADCSSRGYAEATLEAGGLAVGDATWHHGWVLHCAAPNMLSRPRRALALSYFADGATRLATGSKRQPHCEDRESYADWLADVPAGGMARHRLLPLVWDSGKGCAQPLAKPRDAGRAPAKSKAHHDQQQQTTKQPRETRGRGGSAGRGRGRGGAPRRRS